jgi:hypothetical protein
MKALALLLAVLLPTALAASEADVVGVEVTRQPDGRYRFDVAVRHADAGWDHYADAWQILAPDGTLLGERVLLHPHDDEQPFTRSLGDVAVPDGITEVLVRAHDKVHGLGGAKMQVVLPR